MLLKLTSLHYTENHTSYYEQEILVGSESIIKAEPSELTDGRWGDKGNFLADCTRIDLRHALVTTVLVKETVSQIYAMTQPKTPKRKQP